MATPADVLTPEDLEYTGLPEDRLVALIEDAFSLADMISGYRLSSPTFARIPQLRAILRRAIDYYAEMIRKDPSYMVAGPMSVSYARPTLTSGFFSADQQAMLASLGAEPRRVYSLSMGLACSPGARPNGWG